MYILSTVNLLHEVDIIKFYAVEYEKHIRFIKLTLVKKPNNNKDRTYY